MKKALKVLALILALAMVAAMFGCGSNKATSTDATATDATAVDNSGVDYSNIKVGLICLHDENSTYDNNFIQSMKEAAADLGLTDDQVLIKTNIDESDACKQAAEDLAEAGCNFVFADSFGHETYMMEAAKDYPNVQFGHATGTHSKTADIANFHNAFASIYEGRYLAGVVAGLKLNEMIEDGTITADKAVMGYVGAYPYAEVKSGYTSFFLGARSVCESVTMKVVYTNSWFDIALEKEAAEKLIGEGCVLISQHADSEGAPKACEAAGVPDVSYNIDTSSIAPTTALVASRINWAPYFEMAITAVAKGETFATDWCGDFSTGSVEITEIHNMKDNEATSAKVAEVKASLEDGTIKVFDCSKWTVDGANLTEYLADVIDNGDYVAESNVIATENGITYFAESDVDNFRSAPYFDIVIDGITEE